MNEMYSIQKQDFQKEFDKQRQTLMNLTNKTNFGEDWDQQACETTGALLQCMTNQRVTSKTSMLESFAKIVLVSSEERKLHHFQSFVHLFLMHIFSSRLYPQLRDILAHKASGLQGELTFQIPEWWPTVGNGEANSDAFSSPLQFESNLADFAKTRAQDARPILHHIISILSQLQSLSVESNPSWSCFASIISIMSRSVSHRDLATLLLCQDKTAISILHRLSVSPTSTPGQRYAKFILDLLMTRPSLIGSLSILHDFPGAKRLLQMYPQTQIGAFEVAAKTPFRFIVDLLNHMDDSSWSTNSTIVNCISISSRAIEWLGSNVHLSTIYADFNKVSDVRSLLSVCTQFGFITAKCLSRLYGTSTYSSKFPGDSNNFNCSALPPLAKPNYFFAEQKPAPSNEMVAMMAELDVYDEIHRDLLRILNFIKLIASTELKQSSAAIPTGTLGEKIYTRKIQPVYSLLLLAHRCNERLALGNLTSRFTSEAIFDISEIILAEADSSLAWTSLFNCATQASYTEVCSSRIWLEFLMLLCDKIRDSSCQSLVQDSLKKFAGKFSLDSQTAGLSGMSPVTTLQCNKGSIARHEYIFLYENSTGNKGDLEDHSKLGHYSMGGRQQSIHVDKFGKDRA